MNDDHKESWDVIAEGIRTLLIAVGLVCTAVLITLFFK